MIRTLLRKILAPRHPWRALSFSELSEMYLAVFLRTVTLGMIGIFIPVYLLKSGYTFTDVTLFYAVFYVVGIANDVWVAYAVAFAGPKHVMRLSFLLQMVLSLLLINIERVPFAIFTIGAITSAMATSYWLPYHIDFSKIKHTEHGGKEIGFMEFMGRIAGVLGPLAGGVLATIAGPHATFAASGAGMLLATAVLMMSPEPVRTKQKLRWRGLKIKSDWRNYCSMMAFCIEGSVSNILWPVYLAAVVFTGGAYLKIGSVGSLSVFVAIVVAVPLGKLLDKQRGRLMIRYGTVVNTVVHLSRAMVSSLPGSFAVSAVNEPVSLVYRMAYIKGYYDAADDHPGYRITYITSNELISDAARATLWIMLFVLSLHFTPYVVCVTGFVVAAIASLLIRMERFKALR